VFFLLAGDVIRYRIVTGVQTCALPISLTIHCEYLRRINIEGEESEVFTVYSQSVRELSHKLRQKMREGKQLPIIIGGDFNARVRSEERRVGKEGREKRSTKQR